MNSSKTFSFTIDNFVVHVRLNQVGPGFYEIPVLRPTTAYESGFSTSTTEQDFLEDLKMLVPKSIKGSSLSEEFNNCLYSTVLAHTKKFGRILPSDAKAYIATSLLLFTAASKEIYGTERSPMDLNDLFHTTEELLVLRLRNTR